MNAVGKEVLPDEGFADDIRRRSNIIMMGRMGQGVVDLVIRRPLDKSAERLRDTGVDGRIVDGWKCKESVSDEGVCEGSVRPGDEEEDVHTIDIRPELGQLLTDLDLNITRAASVVRVLSRHSCPPPARPPFCYRLTSPAHHAHVSQRPLLKALHSHQTDFPAWP